MFSKTKMVLAAVLMLGVASAAQASGRDDGNCCGGYRVGPMGQTFDSGVNPVYHSSLRNTFDYVAPHRQSPRKKATNR